MINEKTRASLDKINALNDAHGGRDVAPGEWFAETLAAMVPGSVGRVERIFECRGMLDAFLSFGAVSIREPRACVNGEPLSDDAVEAFAFLAAKVKRAKAKPPSVPLSTPDGEVLAWACGLCRRVGSIHGTLGPPDAEQRARLAESSREDADGCCVCRECGVVGPLMMSTECEPCRAKKDAEWKAGEPARLAKQEAEEKARTETFANALDREAAFALAGRMSDISEECYCAGWLSGCEFSLWGFVLDGPGEWGMGTVAAEDIAALKSLSDKCGGWIVWRDDRGEVFVPLAEWLPAYAAEQERSRKWLAEYEARQAAEGAPEA